MDSNVLVKVFRNAVGAFGKRPWRLAMLAAVVSDGLSFGLDLVLPIGEFIQIGVDLLTAGILVVLLGFRWGLAVPLVVEAFPGLALFPTWTLAVLAYAGLEEPGTKVPLPSPPLS